MIKIYKYEVPIAGEFTLDLPSNCKFLSVQTQYGTPSMWFAVDTARPTTPRTFIVHLTGQEVKEYNRLSYLGTFQMLDGSFVGHLFEKKQPHD